MALLLVVVILVTSAAPGYCGPMRKLKRGFWNFLTFYMEVPYQMKKVIDRQGTGMDKLVYGFVAGGMMSVFRLLAGTWEAMSFPIAIPEDYAPIVSDPEFFVDFPPEKWTEPKQKEETADKS
jgi:putative exosortase-associated protein (TIGR04073 family)